MKTNGYAERAIVNRLVEHTGGGGISPEMATKTNVLADYVRRHADDVSEGTARATTRRAIGRLQDKGLVEEYESGSPARQSRWEITEAGLEEAREIQGVLNEQKRKYGMMKDVA